MSDPLSPISWHSCSLLIVATHILSLLLQTHASQLLASILIMIKTLKLCLCVLSNVQLMKQDKVKYENNARDMTRK